MLPAAGLQTAAHCCIAVMLAFASSPRSVNWFWATPPRASSLWVLTGTSVLACCAYQWARVHCRWPASSRRHWQPGSSCHACVPPASTAPPAWDTARSHCTQHNRGEHKQRWSAATMSGLRVLTSPAISALSARSPRCDPAVAASDKTTCSRSASRLHY